jgi:hypothetical protein
MRSPCLIRNPMQCSDVPREKSLLAGRSALIRTLDEWSPAVKINAMPLTMVNRVLILSILYPVTKGVLLPLAKLFDLQAGRLVMGTSLGDKITIVIALLLIAVGGVMIVEFPGIIRAARLVATL